jgi:peptide/nickel transport system substrate-binding protein
MKKVLLFLLSAILVLSCLLTGCSADKAQAPADSQLPVESEKPTDETQGSTEESEKPTEFNQSPFLEGKDLPPVAERLPKEPKISNEMPPHQLDYKIGKYGGTLRTVRMEPIWDGTVWTIATEPLVNSPGRLGEQITPNVVKSYEPSADQKEFTFVLREGMKWSDGEPLTTKDVEFAVNDCLKDEELTPIFPAWLRSAGKSDGTPMELEVIDDYTFKIKFDQPYAGFPLQLTTGDYFDLIKPAHFMKQFHKAYVDEAELKEKIEDAGFQPNEWYNLFNKYNIGGWNLGRPEMLELPVLYPYVHVKDGDVRIFERNPYYFKIDSAGNQLPYIDRMQSTLVQDFEMARMKILAGEVDASYQTVLVNQIALYKENEAKGNYKLYTNTTIHVTWADIFFNMTYDDPNWRKVVQDIRFRQAINLALDKKEIIDTVYYGYGKPAEMQGTEYDLDKANQLLDEIGMTKGADGLRIGPDGKPFTIEFAYTNWMAAFSPMAQLVTEQLKLLGLDIRLKQIDNGLWNTRVNANEIQMTTHFSHGPVYVPWNDWGLNIWGRQWNLWYATGGKEGEEPPADVLNFYKMVESLRALPLEDARKRKQEIEGDMKKNLWYFIPAQDLTQPVTINAKLRNYDDAGFALANDHGGEQWWFDD